MMTVLLMKMPAFVQFAYHEPANPFAASRFSQLPTTTWLGVLAVLVCVPVFVFVFVFVFCVCLVCVLVCWFFSQLSATTWVGVLACLCLRVCLCLLWLSFPVCWCGCVVVVCWFWCFSQLSATACVGVLSLSFLCVCVLVFFLNYQQSLHHFHVFVFFNFTSRVLWSPCKRCPLPHPVMTILILPKGVDINE